MTRRQDDHDFPRPRDGDACPHCGHELRNPAGDRVRRWGTLALFFGLVTGDAAGGDSNDDAVSAVECMSCHAVFDGWAEPDDDESFQDV